MSVQSMNAFESKSKEEKRETDPYRMTRQDYKAQLLETAKNTLRDANPDLEEIDDSIAEQQAIISVFGNDGITHTIDEAAGVTMCDTVGHWNVERLQIARSTKDAAKSLGLDYNEETGEVLCSRCKRWYLV